MHESRKGRRSIQSKGNEQRPIKTLSMLNITKDKNDHIDSGQEDGVVSDGNSSMPTAECLLEPKSEGLPVMDGMYVEYIDGHIDTINKRRKICTQEELEENNSEISIKSFPYSVLEYLLLSKVERLSSDTDVNDKKPSYSIG